MSLLQWDVGTRACIFYTSHIRASLVLLRNGLPKVWITITLTRAKLWKTMLDREHDFLTGGGNLRPSEENVLEGFPVYRF